MNKMQLDREAWAKLDLFAQMGNIGSEVGRALAAKLRSDEARMQAAFLRGMDLINATIKLWAARGDGRIKELLRARELFAQSILTDKVDPKLEEYFMQFARVARRGL